jgi:hypothetical protein
VEGRSYSHFGIVQKGGINLNRATPSTAAKQNFVFPKVRNRDPFQYYPACASVNPSPHLVSGPCGCLALVG